MYSAPYNTQHSCYPAFPVLPPFQSAAAGLYQGTPISIITTLMGMPNMDFVVREARAVVDGQMAIIRLGTCGALRPPARLGSFMVASPGAVCVRWVQLRAVRRCS
jgi:uridine phosphorylase